MAPVELARQEKQFLERRNRRQRNGVWERHKCREGEEKGPRHHPPTPDSHFPKHPIRPLAALYTIVII